MKQCGYRSTMVLGLQREFGFLTMLCHNLYQLFWNMFLTDVEMAHDCEMILCTAGSAVMATPVYELISEDQATATAVYLTSIS